MAKDYAKSFYNSNAWQKCRAAFILERTRIDGGLCQHCRKNLGYIVDHVKEITPGNITNTDITLNQNNFQYLCLACHNIKTFSNKKKV